MELISEDEFLERAFNVPIEHLQWSLAKAAKVDIFVRRDDLIDSSCSGNKFYKLFYNLQHAKKAGYKQILSFGGAYSNHLYALAAAGRDYGFKTIGVVRGERPKKLSPTLQDVENWGMHLHFVSRTEYKNKTNLELAYTLNKTFGDFYSIPEGGANADGFKGTQTIGWALGQQLKNDYTAVCLACGTGNTLAGISTGIHKIQLNQSFKTQIIGFSALKGTGDLANRVIQTANTNINNWKIISGYHAGGYAKKLPPSLKYFNHAFTHETGLVLDPVYTLKMCWGVAQLLRQQYWPSGSRLMLIHTGGLQGRRGFNLSLVSM